MLKKIFTSRLGFLDAELKAKTEGYKVVGKANRPNGDYVVFGRR